MKKALVSLFAILSFFPANATTYAPILNEPTVMVKESNLCDIVEDCIKKYFPEDPEIAWAVFKAESKLNPNAVGYNCVYGPNITSCKVADRLLAVSYDCGIAQVHSYDGKCKKKMFDIETNLQEARKLYESGGWKHWYVWRDKSYLKYLE